MLPDLLTVADVQRRYGLSDPRSARRIVRLAGALEVAGRLYVSRDALARWESERTAAPAGESRHAGVRRRRRRPAGSAPDLAHLDLEFWKEA